MSKRSPDVADVWFPLYAKDWLADAKVRGLTRTQRSILVDLWCLQWQLDALPRELNTLCRMLEGAEPGDLQLVIGHFFTVSDCGNFLYSERLRTEKNKATGLRQKKRKAIAKARKAKMARGYTPSVDWPDNRADNRVDDGPVNTGPSPSPSPSPSPEKVDTISPLPPTEFQRALHKLTADLGIAPHGEG